MYIYVRDNDGKVSKITFEVADAASIGNLENLLTTEELLELGLIEMIEENKYRYIEQGGD